MGEKPFLRNEAQKLSSSYHLETLILVGMYFVGKINFINNQTYSKTILIGNTVKACD